MSELVLSYSTALHLDDSAIRCSQYIGHRATRLISLIGRSEITIAAASVYLASHLRNQPKTLREVSQILGNTEGAVQAVYRRMYAHHHHMLIPLRGEIFGYRPDPADGRSSNVSPLSAPFSCISPLLGSRFLLPKNDKSALYKISYEPENITKRGKADTIFI